MRAIIKYVLKEYVTYAFVTKRGTTSLAACITLMPKKKNWHNCQRNFIKEMAELGSKYRMEWHTILAAT